VKVALVGQPNCGKSTLFNAVVGYRSLTSNFAGTTVEYTHGQARVDGAVIDLVDLPGLYSLTPTNPVEAVARECLLNREWDVVINVIDASQLARSLELTLELEDLQAPMVVCLNMMDEATRKGIVIDSQALAAKLGVPVVETIAARGQGILDSFRAAMVLSRQTIEAPPEPFIYAPEVEDTVTRLAQKLTELGATGSVLPGLATPIEPSSAAPNRPLRSREDSRFVQLEGGEERPVEIFSLAGGESDVAVQAGELGEHETFTHLNAAASTLTAAAVTPLERAAAFPPVRFAAIHLLQSDPQALGELPVVLAALAESRDEITRLLGQPADAAISSARHAACLNLFERVARVTHPRRDWRERVDRIVMHPFWGYVVLILVFLGMFELIFSLGQFGEDHIMELFNALIGSMAQHMNPNSVLFASCKGAVLGTAGAVAIVLPYLLPFLVCLGVLEDLGYLSRVGYLMDVLMHRLGLHGTATLPMLLGYGCSVPAVMATRILSSRRDRFIAAFLAVLVPCSARMTVIMALVGVYLGASYALGMYVLNLLVVIMAGQVLARIWPEISPGMLMEVPAFRLPALKVVVMKTWWRLREFVTVAFPLLVVGSAVLGLIEFFGWQQVINTALSPLTALLGLPRAVGLTLIFGVLRKELSLLMLMQALGTTHVASVMSHAQMIIFTLFIMFYIPCMATLAALFRELGWRLTTAAATTLLALAVVISLAARGILALF
jgi:ferrous iron transporter FeoB